MAKNNNGRTESFEKMLFKAVDKLRKNIDAAEYLYTLHIKPLSRLRDVLLPKLMKGEIRVKDLIIKYG
jgi:flagellar hook-basal body complex protein FliE